LFAYGRFLFSLAIELVSSSVVATERY